MILDSSALLKNNVLLLYIFCSYEYNIFHDLTFDVPYPCQIQKFYLDNMTWIGS